MVIVSKNKGCSFVSEDGRSFCKSSCTDQQIVYEDTDRLVGCTSIAIWFGKMRTNQLPLYLHFA